MGLTKGLKIIGKAIALKCVNSDAKKGHVYEVMSPHKNDPDDCIRVIDDSGEDYMYEKSRFLMIEGGQDIAEELVAGQGRQVVALKDVGSDIKKGYVYNLAKDEKDTEDRICIVQEGKKTFYTADDFLQINYGREGLEGYVPPPPIPFGPDEDWDYLDDEDYVDDEDDDD